MRDDSNFRKDRDGMNDKQKSFYLGKLLNDNRRDSNRTYANESSVDQPKIIPVEDRKMEDIVQDYMSSCYVIIYNSDWQLEKQVKKLTTERGALQVQEVELKTKPRIFFYREHGGNPEEMQLTLDTISRLIRHNNIMDVGIAATWFIVLGIIEAQLLQVDFFQSEKDRGYNKGDKDSFDYENNKLKNRKERLTSIFSGIELNLTQNTNKNVSAYELDFGLGFDPGLSLACCRNEEQLFAQMKSVDYIYGIDLFDLNHNKGDGEGWIFMNRTDFAHCLYPGKFHERHFEIK